MSRFVEVVMEIVEASRDGLGEGGEWGGIGIKDDQMDEILGAVCTSYWIGE